MTRASVYELLSAEYKWTLQEIKALTFMQRHLYLCKLLERQQREAKASRRGQGSADSDDDEDDGGELLTDRDAIRAVMGAR